MDHEYSNTNENTNVNANGYVHTWGPILAFQKTQGFTKTITQYL